MLDDARSTFFQPFSIASTFSGMLRELEVELFFLWWSFFRPPVRHLFCYIFSLSELAFRNIDDEDEHFMFVLALSVLPYQTLCWESQSNSSLTGSGLFNVSPAPASVCILYDFFFCSRFFLPNIRRATHHQEYSHQFSFCNKNAKLRSSQHRQRRRRAALAVLGLLVFSKKEHELEKLRQKTNERILDI